MRVGNQVNAQYYAQEEPREVKKDLGKDEFLKILAAQFRDQNPLDPVSDTEFIAQMAQFSSLEQLQNISAKLDAFQEDNLWGQYLSLLGKEVFGLDSEGNPIKGLVTGVNFREGQFRLSIDGKEQEFISLISVELRQEPLPKTEESLPEDESFVGEGEGVETDDPES